MKRFRVHDWTGLLLTGRVRRVILSAAGYGADARISAGSIGRPSTTPEVQLVGGGDLPLTAQREGRLREEHGWPQGWLDSGRGAQVLYCPTGRYGISRHPTRSKSFQAASRSMSIIIHELNQQIRVVSLDKPRAKVRGLDRYSRYYNGMSYRSYRR